LVSVTADGLVTIRCRAELLMSWPRQLAIFETESSVANFPLDPLDDVVLRCRTVGTRTLCTPT